MATPIDRISRVEGILEQMNKRLGNLESQVSPVLDQKADKSEVRLLFVTTTTLLIGVIGLLGAVIAKI